MEGQFLLPRIGASVLTVLMLRLLIPPSALTRGYWLQFVSTITMANSLFLSLLTLVARARPLSIGWT